MRDLTEMEASHRRRVLAGSKANERLDSFLLDEGEIEVCNILERGRGADYHWFGVAPEDSGVNRLRHRKHEVDYAATVSGKRG